MLSQSWQHAGVAELADAHVWGACGENRTGSIPVSRTKQQKSESKANRQRVRIFSISGNCVLGDAWCQSDVADIMPQTR